MAKNRLGQLLETVQQLQDKIKQDGQASLKEAFNEFFLSHPEAQAIVWTQYTPWFNDGDACTFSVHSFELKVGGLFVAEDVRKLLDTTDGEDFEYQYGDGCAANILASIEDTPENRRYYNSDWNRLRKAGIQLRQLNEREKQLIADFTDLAKSCRALPDVMQMVLGDHVVVTATRNGFDVTEWEHD